VIFSGKELFTDCGDDEFLQLFERRGETLSEHHDPIFLEEGHHESGDAATGYTLVPEVVQVPVNVFEETEEPFLLAKADETLCRKAGNLKSHLERLLDELS
jgi:hypothetical protein